MPSSVPVTNATLRILVWKDHKHGLELSVCSAPCPPKPPQAGGHCQTCGEASGTHPRAQSRPGGGVGVR